MAGLHRRSYCRFHLDTSPDKLEMIGSSCFGLMISGIGDDRCMQLQSSFFYDVKHDIPRIVDISENLKSVAVLVSLSLGLLRMMCGLLLFLPHHITSVGNVEVLAESHPPVLSFRVLMSSLDYMIFFSCHRRTPSFADGPSL
ncbi:Uncharacterised protein at_DN0408 [Pycnogonum litorale]